MGLAVLAVAAAAGWLARGQRLTEILKQDQYAPLSIEKQVLSILVATSGALDNIPVPEVRRFEKEFLQFVETSNPTILKNIAAKKALDDLKEQARKAGVPAKLRE